MVVPRWHIPDVEWVEGGGLFLRRYRVRHFYSRSLFPKYMAVASVAVVENDSSLLLFRIYHYYYPFGIISKRI